MKSLRNLLLLAAPGLLAVLLPGCSTPGAAYASQHPELSAEQRKMFQSGKIATGGPVAGLTGEQIRLIMGRDPAQFTKENGEDAWVWVQPGLLPMAGPVEEQMGAERGGVGRDSGARGSSQYGTEVSANSVGARSPQRTTVYFRGNRATRAVVTDGSL